MKKILPISIGIAVLAWVSYFFWSSSWHTEGELWGIEPNIVDPSADVSARLSGLFYGDIHVDLDSNDPAMIDTPYVVSVDGIELTDVAWANLFRIDVTLPTGLPLGLHDVIAESPMDDTLVLADGLVVTPGVPEVDSITPAQPANIFLPGPGDGIKLDGTGKGSITRDYAIDGLPLLKSFRFSWSSDHHIGSIRVKPGSPVADPSPESMAPGLDDINLIFKDDSSSNEYKFHVEHANLLGASVERRKAFDFCKGECVQQLIRPEGETEFVIIGFSFWFTGNRDHHIDRIGILENNVTVSVVYADKNADDTYKWELEYAYVPTSFIAAKGQVGGLESTADNPGSDSKGFGVGASNAHLPSVIRGFMFDFDKSGADRHLRRIGVITYSTGALAFFADQGYSKSSDKFNWTLRWGLLRSPRQVHDPDLGS